MVPSTLFQYERAAPAAGPAVLADQAERQPRPSQIATAGQPDQPWRQPSRPAPLGRRRAPLEPEPGAGEFEVRTRLPTGRPKAYGPNSRPSNSQAGTPAPLQPLSWPQNAPGALRHRSKPPQSAPSPPAPSQTRNLRRLSPWSNGGGGGVSNARSDAAGTELLPDAR